MNRNSVKDILKKLRIEPEKRLGQNFLFNDFSASEIAGLVKGKSILEIGPGLGALTRHLLERKFSVTGIEISGKLSGFLEKEYSHRGFKSVTADFLQISPEKVPGYPFDSIAGNLPYSISSQILLKLLEPEYSSVQQVIVLLQKEMATRVTSFKGGDYGRLALRIWPYFTARRVIDLDADVFFPEPRVTSSVVELIKRNSALVSESLKKSFELLVDVSFSARRKTFLNNISSIMPKESARKILESMGLDPRIRAEQITPRKFVILAEKIF